MAPEPAPEPPRWSRLEQFCAANGIPVPPPMTPEQRADWERRQDEADAEVERIYGTGSLPTLA